MKKALCAGINNYPGFQNDLRGCINDANDWAAILENGGFNVSKILNDQATRQSLLSELEKHFTI